MTALICNPLDYGRSTRMSSAMQHWLSKPKSSFVEDSWLSATGFTPLQSPVLDNGSLIQIAQADIDTIDHALQAASQCLEQGHLNTIPVSSKRQWIGQLLRQLDAHASDLIQLEHVVTHKPTHWIQQHDLPLATDWLRQAQHLLQAHSSDSIPDRSIHKSGGLTSHHCPTTSELEGLTYYQSSPSTVLVAPIEPGHTLLDTLSAIALMISSGCPLVLHGRPHHALSLLFLMDLVTQLPLPKGSLQCVISDDEPLWMTLRQSGNQHRPLTLLARPHSLVAYQQELNRHDTRLAHTVIEIPQALYMSILTPKYRTETIRQWFNQLHQTYGYPGQGPHLCWVPNSDLAHIHSELIHQPTDTPYWHITVAECTSDIDSWVNHSAILPGLSTMETLPLLLVGYDHVEHIHYPITSQAMWRRLCIQGSDYWLASKLAEQVHADEGWFNDVPTPSRLAQELSEPNHQQHATIHPLSHLNQLSRPRWMHVRL